MTQFATVTALPTGRLTENCKQPGADPEAWFPHEPQADRPDERRRYEDRARQLCAGCPFTDQCLNTELVEAGANTHGIFGGTAPWERAAMLGWAVA